MAHILLIEDEELVRHTVNQILMLDGHQVTVAENGVIGLEMFSKAKPDLVITDIIMPEKEGVETILSLRKADPSVKIIAISGGGRTGNMDFLKAAERLGAARTLKKPVDPSILLEAVSDVLAQ